ncbi:hypothetical protein BAUCODRAFT_149017 [Baudoinia panamericana UAMH 10762]|uniref:Uncharacterized protein n=1 Tax=Baudoinia panamericana (strain UAMH 10762) TaxID=717646 RepID=M2MTW2_BAUPA|nr:uncharacterized protein BAUCODRAFT_149017 [Baudoinia panamericana UAMH 10762]EMC94978.1 hypothetical protein BAUCODRAFT_149017 [Baudoinia panamericana UAMH 10762]
MTSHQPYQRLSIFHEATMRTNTFYEPAMNKKSPNKSHEATFNYKPNILRTLSLLSMLILTLALIGLLEYAVIELPHGVSGAEALPTTSASLSPSQSIARRQLHPIYVRNATAAAAVGNNDEATTSVSTSGPGSSSATQSFAAISANALAAVPSDYVSTVVTQTVALTMANNNYVSMDATQTISLTSSAQQEQSQSAVSQLVEQSNYVSTDATQTIALTSSRPRGNVQSVSPTSTIEESNYVSTAATQTVSLTSYTSPDAHVNTATTQTNAAMQTTGYVDTDTTQTYTLSSQPTAVATMVGQISGYVNTDTTQTVTPSSKPTSTPTQPSPQVTTISSASVIDVPVSSTVLVTSSTILVLQTTTSNGQTMVASETSVIPISQTTVQYSQSTSDIRILSTFSATSDKQDAPSIITTVTGGSTLVLTSSGSVVTSVEGGSTMTSTASDSVITSVSGGSSTTFTASDSVITSVSGGSTAIFTSSGTVITSVSGGSTTISTSSGSVITSVSGGWTFVSTSSGSVITSVSGGSTVVSTSNGSVITSVSGGSTVTSTVQVSTASMIALTTPPPTSTALPTTDDSSLSDNDYGRYATIIHHFTSAQVFLYTYMALLVAVVYRMIWTVIYNNLNLIEPFRMLSEANGAPAERAFFSFYQSQSNLLGSLSALAKGRLLLALTALTYLIACFLPALASEAIFVDTNWGCPHPMDGRNPCTPRMTANVLILRLLQGLLGFAALVLLVLLSTLLLTKTGLPANPSSMATIGSLMRHPGLLEDLSDAPTDAYVSEMKEALRGKRYRLGYYKTASGEPGYGIHATEAGLVDNKAAGHRYEPVAGSHSIRQTHHSAHRMRFMDFILALVVIGTFGVVLAYYLDSSNDGFNRYFSSNTFGPRFILTGAGTIIASLFKSVEQSAVIMAPYKRLAKRACPPRSTILFTPHNTPFVSTFTTLWHGYVFSSLVTAVTLTAEALNIVISGVPYATGETWMQFLISAYMSLVILGIMIVVVVMVIASRLQEPAMPRKPDTLGSVMSYLCGSKCLDDFEGAEWHDERTRDWRIRLLGKSYAFRETTRPRDGKLAWTVDNVQD